MNTQTPPTPLTTQQLWREIKWLEELLEKDIESIKEANKLAHEDRVRVPTDIEKAVGNLRLLQEERFRGMEKQLDMLEKNRLELKADTEKILALAFSTAKEMGDKRDASTTKQMDDFSKRFDDLKERVVTSISTNTGQRTGQKDLWGYIVGAIGLLLAIIQYMGK